jgi:hypothetical protein
MISIISLWLPILLSAVAVFVASSVIHMFLPWHNKDFKKLPAEDEVMAALRPFGIPPGEYVMPHACNNAERTEQGFKDKVTAGPVAFLTVMPSDYGIGKSLSLWFLYCIGMGIFAAYIAGRALAPGADVLEVFRFAGSAAFGGYALALMQNSIWYHRAWSSTFRSMADGLVFSLLTGAAFSWLWPA